MKHFLDVADVTKEEFREIVTLADHAPAQFEQILQGQGVASIFLKPSLRTRNSIEVAIAQLGGHPVTITDAEIGIGSREKLEDIGQVLAGYHQLLALRVFDHAHLERLVALDLVPIVNLLSDRAHPLQAVADVLTIEQELGSVAGKKVTYIGDANNVTRSLISAVTYLGGEMHVVTPKGHGMEDIDRAFLQESGATFSESNDPDSVIEADVIYTDTWFSMGQESQRDANLKNFTGFSVDESLCARNPESLVMHCLPAHRGEEITDGVIDGKQSRVWQQAHNRLPAARAVIFWLLTAGKNR